MTFSNVIDEFAAVAGVTAHQWNATDAVATELERLVGVGDGPLRVSVAGPHTAEDTVRRLGWPRRHRLAGAVSDGDVEIVADADADTDHLTVRGRGVDGRAQVARLFWHDTPHDTPVWVVAGADGDGTDGDAETVVPSVARPEAVRETLAGDETPAAVREAFDRLGGRRYRSPSNSRAAVMIALGVGRAAETGSVDDARVKAVEWARRSGACDPAAVGRVVDHLPDRVELPPTGLLLQTLSAAARGGETA